MRHKFHGRSMLYALNEDMHLLKFTFNEKPLYFPQLPGTTHILYLIRSRQPANLYDNIVGNILKPQLSEQ